MQQGTDVVLVGRDEELATLHEGLEHAASRRQLLLFEGEPGIGKTRLLREASHFATELGFNVFAAAGDVHEQAHAYGLLIAAVESRADRAAGDLRALIARQTSVAADRRLAVIDWFVTFIEEAVDAAPIVLVLDDLHWADAESLRVLRAVVRRSARTPFGLVAGTRPVASYVDLEALADTMGAEGERVFLEPLDESSVVELVDRLMTQTVTPELLALVGSARGNPFFVTEIIASGLGELASHDVPRDLRRTILGRVSHLSDDARSMLRLASLLGGSIDPIDLATIVGRPAIELVPIIEEAIRGGVLEEYEDVLAFRHDLVRDAVYSDMPASLRRRSHRDVARALAAAGAPARRVAAQLARAAKPGDGEAVSWLRRAAAEEAQRSPTLSADMLEQAVGLLQQSDPALDEVQAERVQALVWAGRVSEASALASDVLAELRDAELAVDVRASLGEALFFRGRIAEAVEQLVQACAAGPGSGRGLLLAEAALASLVSGQLDRAEGFIAAAVADAETTNDPRARGVAIGVSSLLAVVRGDGKTGVDLGREAVRIADDDFLGETHRYGGRFFLGLALGDVDLFDEAVDVIREGIRLDEMHGVSWILPCYHGLLSTVQFARGDWDDAVAELETSNAILDDIDSTLFGPLAHGVLAQIAFHRDDISGCEREFALCEAELALTGPQVGMAWIVQAQALLAEDAGNPEEAAAIMRGAWAFADENGIRNVLRQFGPMYVRLALAEGDRAAAGRAVEAVELYARSMETRSMTGTALLCRGMLEADQPTLYEAVETLRGAGRPLELAAACLEAGTAFMKGKEATQGRALLDDAADIYQGLGALRDLRRVSEALGGDAGGRKVAKRRPVSGWRSLSPTELRVVAQVAEGLANPAIAEKLVVSRRTVETHVSHLFRKLNVTSRVELVLLASRELGAAEVQ